MLGVDLGESFPTSIYLQNLASVEKDWTTLLACLLASIQPRTSPSKFGEKYSLLFTGVLKADASSAAKSSSPFYCSRLICLYGLLCSQLCTAACSQKTRSKHRCRGCVRVHSLALHLCREHSLFIACLRGAELSQTCASLQRTAAYVKGTHPELADGHRHARHELVHDLDDLRS